MGDDLPPLEPISQEPDPSYYAPTMSQMQQFRDYQGQYRPSFARKTYYQRKTRSRRQNLRKIAKECMLKLTELKHSTTNIATTGVTTSGASTAISDLSQGTSSTTRIGQQIHVSELNIWGDFSLPAASSWDLCRFIVVVDKQPDGALPSTTNFLETAAVLSPYNKDFVPSRFRILWDFSVPLNNNSATVTVDVKPFHLRKKLNFVTYYQGNAGTISDLLRNNIFVYAVSGNGLANLNCNVQFCYKDL